MTKLLLSEAIHKYAEAHSSAESEALAQLNRETHLKVEMPVMLSGHLQGAVLSMLSHMIQPRTILEIGTYTGYSAICLAQGLKDTGILHTIDINEELEDMARAYFIKSGVAHKIQQHIGNAGDIIPKIDASFDLVFIDADKKNYSLYYDLVIDRVPPGGYLIADNVLFNGEVVEPEENQSKNAKAMHRFNEKIKADTRVEKVLMPVRDGLLVMRKVV